MYLRRCVKGERVQPSTFDKGPVHRGRGSVDVTGVVVGRDVLEHRTGVAQTLQHRIHETLDNE